MTVTKKFQDSISNYFFCFLILFVITNYVFKRKCYKHQFIAIIIILLSSFLKNLYFHKYSLDLLLFTIKLINDISLSFFIIFSKIIMEKYYFSPYKNCYIFGIINLIITLILYIVISNVSCKRNSICSIEYNHKYYIDKIGTVSKNNTAQIVLYILIYIFNSIFYILLNIIIHDFTICHIFLPYQIYAFFNNLVGFDSFNYKFLIIITLIIELFATLIFNEIIQLNICGLNKYTKINIQKKSRTRF